MEYIVDFQGFQNKANEFIVKEFAVLNLDNESDVYSATFKPPYKWISIPTKYRCTNQWLIRNFHGIPWETGSIVYSEHKEIINKALESAVYIYVKGMEKKKWLLTILDDLKKKSIIDLEDMECPSLNELQSKNCINHNVHLKIPSYTCAVNNVIKLQSWFHVTWGSVSSLKKSVQLFNLLDNLEKMRTADIENLPPRFILLLAPDSITDAWDKLPEKFKNNKDFIEYQRCLKHFDLSPRNNDRTEFDGPIPRIKDCKMCQENK